MTYAGLTTADKGALLEAKAVGFKVFCETSNGGRVFYSKYPSVSEANSRIISIDLALAQIAEMELTEEMPAHMPRHEAPPTHKDVLLKTWAQDTEEMAKKLIKYDNEDGGYFYDSIDTKSGRSYSEFYEVALKGEIAYLNSAAEVGK